VAGRGGGPWMSSRMRWMLAHAAMVAPVVTAVWETSIRKKCVGGIGGRTCKSPQR